jgi:hypothetical protein
MMNVNIYDTNIFPYLEGEALVDSLMVLTIYKIVVENLQGHGGKKEEKYVLYFKENPKGFVLNKTNAKRIAQMHGDMTGDWAGKQITLTTERVNAFGETHNAIRVVPGAIGHIENPVNDPENWMDLLPGKTSFFQHARDDLGLLPDAAASMLKAEGFTNGYDPVAAPDMWQVLLRAPMPQATAEQFGMDDIEAEEEIDSETRGPDHHSE